VMDSRLQAWITCVRSLRKSASQASAFPHTPKRRWCMSTQDQTEMFWA